MPAPKTALCIMDMATLGRASLSVALPALAACGVQGCGLPASLFSSHTGGFSGVRTLDTGDFARDAIGHYLAEGIAFDAVYIGYLRGPAQLAAAERALDAFPAAYKVVDPALGDGGRAYSGIDGETIRGMAALCMKADLITPNLTECALLSGEDPAQAADEDALRARASGLVRPGASLLVTGIPAPRASVAGESAMAVVGRDKDETFTLTTRRLPADFPGTGDLFTASVLGLLLAGHTLAEAARQAAAFVGTALRATLEGEGEARLGLWLEPQLPLLAGMARGEEVGL